MIPRTVDDLDFFRPIRVRHGKKRLGNPVWHIHSGAPPEPEVLTDATDSGRATISFAMLLNLAAVSNDENRSYSGFLRRYCPSASPQTHPSSNSSVGYAVTDFLDFVAPKKRYRGAHDVERGVLEQLSSKAAPTRRRQCGRDPAHALRYRRFRVSQDRLRQGGPPAARPRVSNEFSKTNERVSYKERKKNKKKTRLPGRLPASDARRTRSTLS